MKIHFMSDIHLEHADCIVDQEAVKAADVVVLAGDIGVGTEALQWARDSFGDKPVVYVVGNHEFYGFHFDKLLDTMREDARAFNIHFLENDSVTVDGYRFMGCTLWTDFDYFGRGTRAQNMVHAEKCLNDFRHIKATTIQPPEVAAIMEYGDGKLRPIRWSRKLTTTHTLGRHQASMAWLRSELPKGEPGRTIVLTHHFPHKSSCDPDYSNDPLTAIYGSHVDHAVLLGARLWIHGHTHSSSNYRIGDSKRSVRVMANPRGYPFGWLPNEYENKWFNPKLVVDLDDPDDGPDPRNFPRFSECR